VRLSSVPGGLVLFLLRQLLLNWVMLNGLLMRRVCVVIVGLFRLFGRVGRSVGMVILLSMVRSGCVVF